MEKVLIAGGRGTVGSHLQEELRNEGFDPYVLTRNKVASAESEHMLLWDPSKKILEADLNEFSHLINLAGEGIADKRWTKKRKKEIIDSRVQTTRFLSDLLKEQEHQIQTFISASATGFYGNSRNREMSEGNNPINEDFLSQVCQLWEEAAHTAKGHVSRFHIIRIGTVLTTEGGAFPKLTATIPAGVINTMGNGKQYMSWIHITDLCRMVAFLLKSKARNGAYNAVSPQPVTNSEFVKKLKETWKKPAIIVPAPAFALKVALGEMSAVVLNSNKVSSEKIQNEGFAFRYGKIENAIDSLLSS